MDLDLTYKTIISILLAITALIVFFQSGRIPINNKTIKLAAVTFFTSILLALSSWFMIGGSLTIVFYILALIWPLIVIFHERIKL